MLPGYLKMLRREFNGYNLKRLSMDVMAGLTVTAVALPLALAFGVSCGASAAAGMVTAIIAGLVIGALSGASFQISGPTGAMGAVLVGIVSQYGIDGMFTVSILAGLLILCAALLKLGRIVNMIPRAVVCGFTSGIALIIALGQIDNFFGVASSGEGVIERLLSYAEFGFSPSLPTLGVGLFVVLFMLLWPKKWNARVPASLAAIVFATALSAILHLDVATVGEIPQTIFLKQRFSFSGINWNAFGGYLSPAISVALLGMIESLLCGASGSRMKNEPFSADQELLAQGVGNLLIPFFGGVPATAAIARSSVAIKSGCQTRVCSIVHALGLLASMLLLGGVMARLPIAALAGVLMVTAWRMNEWHFIKEIFSRRRWAAVGEFAVTMVCTVVFDLTVAIVIGVAFAALLFLVKSARLDVRLDGARVSLSGAVFFANTAALEALSPQLSNFTDVEFDLSRVSAIDHSGALALRELCVGIKRARFTGASERVEKSLRQAELI